MIWETWQFFTRALENLKIGTLMGFVNPKEKKYELKTYWGVMCHDNEEWCEIWREIDLPFQNWHEKFNEFRPEHLTVSKIFTLMRSFWAKYILFELKKYRGVFFDDTEERYKIWKKQGIWQILTWALESLKNVHLNGLLLSKVYIFHNNEEGCKIWRKTDLWFEKWHQKFGKFSPELSKESKLRLIRKCKTLNFTEELCTYVSWQWKIMQNLKRNWLFISKLTWGI